MAWSKLDNCCELLCVIITIVNIQDVHGLLPLELVLAWGFQLQTASMNSEEWRVLTSEKLRYSIVSISSFI